MGKVTNIYLYDLRKEPPDEDRDLGIVKRFFLSKAGCLEIGTDLAYMLRIFFSKEDLYHLHEKITLIKKTELELKEKRRAKEEAKRQGK